MFEEIAGHGWTWRHDHVDEHGMQASRISKELVGANVLNENDWPVIITFLKKEIIAIDQYWTTTKDLFES